MNLKLRRIISLALTVVMLFTMLPMDVLAALIVTDYSEGVSVRSIIPVVHTHSYKFYNGSNLVGTQIVKDGEVLVEPAVPTDPSGSGFAFSGWYDAPEGGNELTFGAPITVSSTEEINVYARYAGKYNVNFVYINTKGTTIVLGAKAVSPGATVDAEGISYEGSLDPKKAFSHWSLSNGGTAVTLPTAINANTTLYLVTKNVWKVTFNTNGGSPVAPAYVLNGQTLAGAGYNPETTRAGYDFNGWKLNGSTFHVSSTVVTSDITVEAEWKPINGTPYRVVYFFENPDDTGYTYATYYTDTGKTGDTIVPDKPTNLQYGVDFTNFTYHSSETKTINGDGSTIVSVYYKRKTFTLSFEHFIGSRPFATYPKKFGASVQAEWDDATSRISAGYAWKDQDTNEFLLEAPKMPGRNLELKADSMFINDPFIFLEQNAAGDIIREIKILRAARLKPNYGGAPLEGFTWKKIYGRIGGWYNWYPPGYVYTTTQGVYPYNYEVKTYYERNSYTVTYATNGGPSVPVASVPFDSVLTAYSPSSYVVNGTTKTENGITYVFKGWYDNLNLAGSAFNFASRMPARNIVLYAKWEVQKVMISWYPTWTSTGTGMTVLLNQGQSLYDAGYSPQAAVPAGVTQDDVTWYRRDNGVNTRFALNSPVLENGIELYPRWPGLGFTVAYNANGGTGAPTDSSSYALNSQAIVKKAPTAPAGKAFLGWKSSVDNQTYYPGDIMPVSSDITMTALWGDVKAFTSLRYKANGGTGEDVVYDDLLVNSTHTVIQNPFTRAGYQFVGWNTQPNGNGISYNPGQTVLIDGVDNVLYAKWEAFITVTAFKYWNFPAPGIARPEIYFTLYRTNPYSGVTDKIGTKLVPDAATGGAVSWDNQLYTDGQGHEYVYYVKETTASGLDYTPPSFTKSEQGLEVTNTYQYIDYTVEKIWAGEHLPEVKPTVCFQLQQSSDNGVTFADVPDKHIELTSGQASYTWYNLPTQDSSGKTLKYRAIEHIVPESYVVSEHHTAAKSTITNTYQTASFKVTKNWSDPMNLKTPGDPWPAIQIQLYRDGVEYDVDVNGDGVIDDYLHVPEQQANSFSYTFTKLPKFRSDGTAYVYTARELVVPARYFMTAQDTANESVINNRLSQDSLTGTKYWQGDLPAGGASVTLQLYQTVLGQPPEYYRKAYENPVTVTAADNWQHTWTGMPGEGTVNGQNVFFEYEVDEVSPPTGYYHDAVSSASLYVTNISQKISFTVTKLWENGINNRPASVTLYLERRPANSTSEDDWTRVTGTNYELTPADLNTHTWTGLDHYHTWHATDKNLRVKYEYRVREEAVENYTISYPDNSTVKNTYEIPKRTISIAKEWSGGKSADHVKPVIWSSGLSAGNTSPVVTLWRRFMDDTVEKVDSDEYVLSVTPASYTADSFTFTFVGLNDTDADGNKLLYGFTEDPVEGYETIYSSPYLLGGVNYALPESTITNKYIVPMTAALTATKYWVGGPEADHQRVKLSIFRTIDEVPAVGPYDGITMEMAPWFLATVTPPGGISETFTGFWPDLAATDNDGNPYTYFFIEDNVPTNYIRTYSDAITINGVEYARNDTNVINTYVPPTTTVTASKIWENGAEADHTAVALSLYRKLEGGSLELVTKAYTVNPATGTANRFDYSWEVPQTDGAGRSYTYYFTENVVPNYNRTYSAFEEIGGVQYGLNGASVTNTYVVPKIDVTTKKIWQNGPLSDHVTLPLELYRKLEGGNLEPVTAIYTVSPPTTTYSADGGSKTEFTYTWQNLDKTDINGNVYTYYFKEEAVPGYERIYDVPFEIEYGQANAAVTNKYIQPIETVNGEKIWIQAIQNDTLPDVYMKLWRSTDVSGAALEEVPNAGLIRIKDLPAAVQDPENDTWYRVVFSWQNIYQKSLAGEQYYFFVKEVDSLGDPYTPDYFKKYESGTTVQNIYSPHAIYTPPAIQKVLVGRELKEGEFEFEIVHRFSPDGTNDVVLGTLANDANGKVQFPSINISELSLNKTQIGYIREKIPANTDERWEDGMTYDNTTMLVAKIDVTDSGANDGQLNLTVTYYPDLNCTPGTEITNPVNNPVEFTNTYTAEGSFTPEATKVLAGRELQEGEFTFQLRKEGNPTVIGTATNGADGKVSFTPIQYTQDDIGKTYVYTINEIPPSPGETGMDYDDLVVTVSVKIEDARNGQLTVTPTYSADAVFDNTFTPLPSISVSKNADKAQFTALNEEIIYTVTVTNTGNVPLTEVVVTDSLKNDFSTLTPVQSIADNNVMEVGETWTYTYTHNVTQDNMDAGEIVNTAKATAKYAETSIEHTTARTVPGVQNPSASIEKTATAKYNNQSVAVDAITEAGTEVTYTYTVTNTGNVTLTGLAVTDTPLGAVTLKKAGIEITTLAPGESATGTKTYTVTQDNIDVGTDIVNTASLTANQSIPTTKTTETIGFTQSPAMSISKSAGTAKFLAVGETVTYTVVLENTGNITLEDVVVSDSLVDIGTVTPVESKTTEQGGTAGALDVGETWTYTYTYNVTQDDMDRGFVKNVVKATNPRIPEGDPNVPKVEHSLPGDQNPNASVTKEANKKTFDAPGLVTYTYTIENIGNVTLTGIELTDDKLGPVTLTQTTLGVGESFTVTKGTNISQADINKGENIVNVATVTADQTLPDTAKGMETVTITRTPAATLTKVANPAELSVPGTVTYTYTVKNTGNTTLEGLAVSDDKLGAVTLDRTTLLPNESTTGSLSYTVTQDDINGNTPVVSIVEGKTSIVNLATLTSTTQGLGEVTKTASVTLNQQPGASVTNTADKKVFSSPGVVKFTYTVTNTGNVTLTNVVLTDGAGTVNLGTATLAPGESKTVTREYPIDQADIDAGTTLTNTATVTADQNIGEVKATEIITIIQNPFVVVTKAASCAQDMKDNEGNIIRPGTVTYTYTVKNTGNVTLTEVKVYDDVIGAYVTPESGATINVGQTVTFTKDFAVTQDHIDGESPIVSNVDGKPSIVNTATVTAKEALPETKTSETISFAQMPNASIIKVTAAQYGIENVDPLAITKAGTVVTYTYTVKNEGNVTLTGLELTDDKLVGSVTLRNGQNEVITALAPGESATGTRTYTVKQSDIDTGAAITNKAALTSTTPNLPVTTASATINFSQNRAMSVVKTADKTKFENVGDVITYTVVLKNEGNVTIENIVAKDYIHQETDITAIPVEYREGGGGTTGALDVGETWTYTYTYTAQQKDMNAGNIKNYAYFTATGITGYVSGECNVPGVQNKSASIDKVASYADGMTVTDPVSLEKKIIKPGKVTYTYTVTNTGNVTLTDVAVTDNPLGAVTLNETTLNPGDSATGTKEYIVTQADINAGTAIVNTATLTSTTQGFETITTDETITFKQTPDAEITKVASYATGIVDNDGNIIKPGRVTYTYTVTNTGNVTLTGLAVTDNKLTGGVTLLKNDVAVTALAPGESAAGTLYYDVTQADINDGTAINNVATLTSATQGFEAKTAEETITFAQNPSATLTNTADKTIFSSPGEVKFTYTLTNTGNITLTNVVLTDGAGAVNLGTNTLAPGESKTVEKVYPITQEDIDAHSQFINTATVTANQNIPKTQASSTINIERNIAAVSSKAANPAVVKTAGTVVTYTYRVRNTGNVTLTNVNIYDDKLDQYVTNLTPKTLAPGEIAEGTLQKEITQAEVNANNPITNTATVKAVTAKEGYESTVAQANATIRFDSLTDAELIKYADQRVHTKPGTVTYTYKITNIGDTELTGLELTDSKKTDNNGKITLQTQTLQPNQFTEATWEYNVTQADIDAGTAIKNVATLTSDTQDFVTKTVEETITFTQNPAATLQKVATAQTPGGRAVDPKAITEAGTVVTYTYTVTNTGNVTLNGVTVHDNTLNKDVDNLTPKTLAPGASATGTLTYTVKQSDIDAGTVIENTAAVTAAPAIPATTASETIGFSKNPSMTIVKTANKEKFMAVGEAVQYEVVVTNTGNVSLNNVVVTDSLVTLTPAMRTESRAGEEGCTADVLDVGETWTYNYTYNVKQSDMNTGSITNTVKAYNTDIPANNPKAPAFILTLPGEQNKSATVEKLATAEFNNQAVSIDAIEKAGTVVTYTYTVTNNGNVTLNNLVVTDNILGAVTLKNGASEITTTLAPNESATGKKTYVVKQSDIDTGTSITNKATVTAAEAIPATEDDATIAFTQNRAMSVTKTANRGTFEKVGDVINYTVTVKNDGNVTLTGVQVKDSLKEFTDGMRVESINFNNILEVGETWTYTYIYNVTQDDMDAGSIANSAWAYNSYFPENSANMPEDDLVVTTTQNPAVTVEKTANVSAVKKPGIVEYTVKIENTGNVTLKNNITVSDSLVTLEDTMRTESKTPDGILEVGEIWTYKYNYPVTQAHIDAGTVIQNAFSFKSDELNAAKTDSMTITVTQEPKMTVAKTANKAKFTEVGETIEYIIVVSNPGNITLENVQVTDTLADFANASVTKSINEDAHLDAGETWTYTYTHTVTQADMDAGSIANTATATHPKIQTSPSSSVTLTTTQNPVATISKTASPDKITTPGVVTYTYTVTNTGNVTLTNLVVVDTPLGAVTLKKAGAETTTLAPGASATGTMTFTVTQDHIDLGDSITNAVTVASLQSDNATMAETSRTVAIEQTPGLSITKSADKAEFTALGEEITYTIEAKNTGNVTVKNVVISDSLKNLGDTDVTVNKTKDNDADLDVGETWTYSYKHKVTQADMDRGIISNTATLTVVGLPGDPLKAEKYVTGVQTPDAELTKAVSYAEGMTNLDGKIIKPGTVTYTYTIKNTGDVTLTHAKLYDDKLGYITTNGGEIIEVGQTKNYTKTYTVTQADIDAGADIVNWATVTADQDIPETKKSATISFAQTCGMTVAKTADKTEFKNVGEVIEYTVVATNTGNVTLKNVAVTDSLVTINNAMRTESKTPDGILEPGETWTYVYSYAANQADMNAGSISNSATATSSDFPECSTGSPTVTVDAVQSIKASVTKVASPDSFSKPGLVTYTYTVKNTGNVTLKDVALTDDILGAVTLDKETLLPGASATGKLTYTVTQDDIDGVSDNISIDNGIPTIKNKATVTSSTAGLPETETTESISFTQTPNMTVEKSADKAKFYAVGEEIEYTVVITNTGNVTLTNVDVTDSLFTNFTATPTQSIVADDKLQVGEKWTYTYKYAVKQADMDAGSVANLVTVKTAELPDGKSMGTSVTGEQNPSAMLVKTPDPMVVDKPCTVTYTYFVPNNGNVTLSNVKVVDDPLGEVTLVFADETKTIAPGGHATGTKTKVITQADIDAGTPITNTATVTASQLAGSLQTSATITFDRKPAMEITKTADKTKFTAINEVITYTLKVKNTGNVTLKNVVVTDSLVTLTNAMRTESKTEDGILEVGETWTYSYTYTTNQDDMDKGHVTNSAKAIDTVEIKEGNPAVPTANVSVPGDRKPAAAFTKEADTTLFGSPGTVTYTYTVTNTGNTTLTNIKVVDNKLGDVTLKKEGQTKTSLAPGESATGTLEYNVTQADIDSGADIKNVATLTAAEISQKTDTETVTIEQNPGMSVAKSSTATTYAAKGDVIPFKVVITNTGNISLENIVVADSLVTLTNDMRTGDTDGDGLLDVDETWTYTYNYTVKQSDIDRGYVENSVKAYNTRIPEGTLGTTGSVRINATQNPKASISVTATPKENIDSLISVLYTYTVTNTGNMTLTNLKVTDNKFTLGDITLDKTVLAPGETATATRRYAIKQADIDAGADITNTARLTASQNIGETTNFETISFRQNPGMTILKLSDKNNYTTAGEFVNYSVQVKNTGNITLENVLVTDSLITLTNAMRTESIHTNGKLDVNETWTYKYGYKVTQDDIEIHEQVTNAATAKVTPTGHSELTDTSEKTVYAQQKPEITVKKQTTAATFDKLGEQIPYEVIVENTGNMTLRNVVVTDSLITLTDDMRTGDKFNDGHLGVGEKWTYTYNYYITQDDLDAGFVKNSVKATNDEFFPADDPLITPPGKEHTLNGERKPAMTVKKTTEKTGFSWIGEEITYEIVVENTGNVTLEDVVVKDSLVDLTAVSPAESKTPDGKLQVGETWTYNYNYKTTQADFDAREIENSVKAYTTNTDIPDGSLKMPTYSVNLPFKEVYGMIVSKTTDKPEFNEEGEEITYTVVVENTGNMTLENVVVTDSLIALTDAMRTESKTTDGKLEMGETWTYKYVYTITEADMDAEAVINIATATHDNIPEDDPNTMAEHKLPANQEPSVKVTKSADRNKFNAVGDVITYTITITNNGNIRLRDLVVTDTLVKLTDDMRTESMTADGILEVGETWTYTYTYVITVKDMVKGFVSNSVKVTSPHFPESSFMTPPRDRLEMRTDKRTGPTAGELSHVNVTECYE